MVWKPDMDTWWKVIKCVAATSGSYERSYICCRVLKSCVAAMHIHIISNIYRIRSGHILLMYKTPPSPPQFLKSPSLEEYWLLYTAIDTTYECWPDLWCTIKTDVGIQWACVKKCETRLMYCGETKAQYGKASGEINNNYRDDPPEFILDVSLAFPPTDYGDTMLTR